MARCEEVSDVTVVSAKGQVVIPHALRTKLGIGPKTKLLVYGRKDTIVMKKLEVRDLEKELEAMYKRVNERIVKYGSLIQEDVEAEIQAYRKEKAKHR